MWKKSHSKCKKCLNCSFLELWKLKICILHADSLAFKLQQFLWYMEILQVFYFYLPIWDCLLSKCHDSRTNYFYCHFSVKFKKIWRDEGTFSIRILSWPFYVLNFFSWQKKFLLILKRKKKFFQCFARISKGWKFDDGHFYLALTFRDSLWD